MLGSIEKSQRWTTGRWLQRNFLEVTETKFHRCRLCTQEASTAVNKLQRDTPIISPKKPFFRTCGASRRFDEAFSGRLCYAKKKPAVGIVFVEDCTKRTCIKTVSIKHASN